MVKTKRIALRPLWFDSLGEALTEIQRLAQAHRDGCLNQRGNWDLGTTLGHLAWWIDTAFDGGQTSPPWIMRKLGPMMKGWMLKKTFPQGVRMPGAPEGTYGVERLSLEEGLERVRRAYGRLNAARPATPNLLLGRLTHAEWIALHCRHAQLHLGYFETR